MICPVSHPCQRARIRTNMIHEEPVALVAVGGGEPRGRDERLTQLPRDEWAI
jgi:hypothetical protein